MSTNHSDDLLATGREAMAREAIATGREWIDLDDLSPVDAPLGGFTPEGMKKHRFLPVREESGRLIVATPEWREPLHRDEIERFLSRPVRFAACDPRSFDGVVDRWVDIARSSKPASSGLGAVHGKKDKEEERRLREQLEDSSPVVRTLNSLLIDAVRKGASDIHIEAEEGATVVRFRIDGVLIPAIDPIDASFHPRLVSRIKVVSELDISETRKPQDGRFQFTAFGKAIDFRVSIIPSAHGEDVVIRILDKEHLKAEFAGLSLDRLGFSQEIIVGIRDLTLNPHGMFLVTGPTGSGKTTSLYGALQEMDHRVRKFITIEDPVEYHLPGIVQIPVNEAKGVTFATGLRSVLRHDPDVVMVGEIRDRDTAEVAVQAALTGHLVFSTVHANNSIDVILRFLHMGIEPYNFVSAVNGVLSQRLLRKLCTKCRRRVVHPPERLAAARVVIPSGVSDPLWYEPAGCDECFGTGFRGRMAAGELVPFTEEVRDWMVQRRSFGDIRTGLRKLGVASLREDALAHAMAGHTSLCEIDRVTSAKEV